jgi:osmoprotectant transport system ATP-binding protein
LTAYQNVALMADYLGWPAQRIDKRVTELAPLTQLPLDMLTQLSGGQRQRVSLMRALILDPDSSRTYYTEKVVGLGNTMLPLLKNG